MDHNGEGRPEVPHDPRSRNSRQGSADQGQTIPTVLCGVQRSPTPTTWRISLHAKSGLTWLWLNFALKLCQWKVLTMEFSFV